MSDGITDARRGGTTCPCCHQERNAEEQLQDQIRFTEMRMQERDAAEAELVKLQEEYLKLAATLDITARYAAGCIASLAETRNLALAQIARVRDLEAELRRYRP